MLHAYRLLYRDSFDAPDSLWEWHQPWIDHLLWHAQTFGREVVHCYFATCRPSTAPMPSCGRRPMLPWSGTNSGPPGTCG
jgi:hypothetical protein